MCDLKEYFKKLYIFQYLIYVQVIADFFTEVLVSQKSSINFGPAKLLSSPSFSTITHMIEYKKCQTV